MKALEVGEVIDMGAVEDTERLDCVFLLRLELGFAGEDAEAVTESCDDASSTFKGGSRFELGGLGKPFGPLRPLVSLLISAEGPFAGLIGAFSEFASPSEPPDALRLPRTSPFSAPSNALPSDPLSGDLPWAPLPPLPPALTLPPPRPRPRESPLKATPGSLSLAQLVVNDSSPRRAHIEDSVPLVADVDIV